MRGVLLLALSSVAYGQAVTVKPFTELQRLQLENYRLKMELISKAVSEIRIAACAAHKLDLARCDIASDMSGVVEMPVKRDPTTPPLTPQPK